MPEPAPEMTATEIHTAFNQLANRITTSLEHGDDTETSSILLKMRAMQKKYSELITGETIAEYELRTRTLQLHVQELKDEIATMAKAAVSSSRAGKAEDLQRCMQRLTAIHAAHPRLLDNQRLERIRHDVAVSTEDRRQHGRTTKKLLERERVITAEIERLAEAVHAFHRTLCSGLASDQDIRRAEANYQRTVRSIQAHDADWLAAVVLEMADLLAEWTVPPHGAGRQIDRFLDGISAGLDAIRDQMRLIDDERDSNGGRKI
jgi:hypothetical protein